MYSVYAVQHRASGRVYIGKTSDVAERWAKHRSDSVRSRTYFHCALRKYGAESFDWWIVSYFESDSEAKSAESEWIARLKDFGVELFNLTAGGDGVTGYKHGPESLQKMATSMQGRVFSDESRAKMSAAQRRRRHPPEIRAKIAAANLGRKKSAEACAKQSISRRGMKFSAEARANMSAGARAREQRKRAASNPPDQEAS